MAFSDEDCSSNGDEEEGFSKICLLRTELVGSDEPDMFDGASDPHELLAIKINRARRIAEYVKRRFAVRLCFHANLQDQLVKAWSILGRHQITDELTESMHITLFVTSSVLQPKLKKAVKAVARMQDILPISFSSIGTLTNNMNILFVAPTPSVPLLQFHQHLFEAMIEEGIEVAEEYRPNYWIPFCTIAEQVPNSRMEEAFTALRELNLPVHGLAVAIKLVEFPVPEREA